jgi:hypothetical protein
LLSFIVKIMSLMPCFKYFDLSTQCFTSLIKIVMVHVTSKIIVLLALTYSRTSRSYAWRCLIRLKHIYNFWCSMLIYTPFSLCFVTLRGVFMHFPELTY